MAGGLFQHLAHVPNIFERGRHAHAATDVSMDQLVRAFTAAGGVIKIKVQKQKPTKAKRKTAGARTTVVDDKDSPLVFEMETST